MNKNIKNEKSAIDNESLESVTGGTAPELPAENLKSGGYNSMFSNPQGFEQKELRFYDEKVVDPSCFTKKY